MFEGTEPRDKEGKSFNFVDYDSLFNWTLTKQDIAAWIENLDDGNVKHLKSAKKEYRIHDLRFNYNGKQYLRMSWWFKSEKLSTR
jgi:hypothetical protein